MKRYCLFFCMGCFFVSSFFFFASASADVDAGTLSAVRVLRRNGMSLKQIEALPGMPKAGDLKSAFVQARGQRKTDRHSYLKSAYEKRTNRIHACWEKEDQLKYVIDKDRESNPRVDLPYVFSETSAIGKLGRLKVENTFMLAKAYRIAAAMSGNKAATTPNKTQREDYLREQNSSINLSNKERVEARQLLFRMKKGGFDIKRFGFSSPRP